MRKTDTTPDSQKMSRIFHCRSMASHPQYRSRTEEVDFGLVRLPPECDGMRLDRIMVLVLPVNLGSRGLVV